MIENYDEVMRQWSGGDSTHVGTCCYPGMDIFPDEDLNRWSTQQTVTLLANSDYYYTRTEVDELIKQSSGMTEAEVRELIEQYTRNKADKSEVNALAEQVRENTQKILGIQNSLLTSYYTKLQTNEMFANYSKVDGTTLSLNNENITI